MSPKTIGRIALRKLGLERVRTPNFADLMGSLGVETLLDVGANTGQYAREVRELGYRGRIISFEPIPEVFAQLEQNSASDPSWEAHMIALGERNGPADIGVSEKSVFSSFKRPADYLVANFQGAAVVQTQAVEVRRLDTFLGDRRADYLKIDTQGFEREVLEGAGSRLQSFKAVQLELPMRGLYEDQPDWLSMATWMNERGFTVAMAKENGYDWRTSRLLELDVVFVRS